MPAFQTVRDEQGQEPYRVEAASLDAEAQEIINLWADNLGHPERRAAKLEWFYRCNPVHRAEVFLLRDARQPQAVGVTGLACRQIRIGEHLVDGGLMADFAVDAHHRTLFPALTLQRTVLQLGLTHYDLLYGFPNPKSLPVVRRAGYEVLGGMSRYVCVLRTRDYLPRWIPASARAVAGQALDVLLRLRRGLLPRLIQTDAYSVAWADQPDDRFNALWATRPNNDLQVIGIRDCAFLAWRFAPKPWHRYRFFVVSNPATDQMLGYAVCEPDNGVLHVRDLLAAGPEGHNLPILLRALMREARKQGHRSVSLEFMCPADTVKILMRAGLRAREHSSQPMILATSEDVRVTLQPYAWYLTRADIDE